MTRRMLAASAMIVLAACSGSTEPSGAPPLLRALPRVLSNAEVATIAANNEFAFDLLGRIVAANPEDNTFISPLSVSMALGMVMNGAHGPTRDAMATTLGFGTLPQADINDGYRSLIALLRGLDRQVEFTIANSVWAALGYPVRQSFLDDARQYFDAEARTLDFASATALGTINDWVRQKTAGRIPTILDRIQRDEILFAINAIYFKGLWREQFRPSETAQGPFTAADGSVRNVPFMARNVDTPYYEGTDFQAVDLWYGAGAHTMTVLVPTGTTTATALVERLDRAAFARITDGMSTIRVDLRMPKLRLEYKRSMADDLKALGMGIAFSAEADLSGIGPQRPYISRVEHKTFVEVNEEGTEAAAATAVGVGIVSAPRTAVVRVDRPFVVVLRERLSGTIVFVGRINEIPS